MPDFLANPTLGDAFDFSDDDLAANRAGRLSTAQRDALMKVLGRHLYERRRLPVVGIGVLVVSVGLLATAAVRTLNRVAVGGLLPLVVAALLAGVVAAILIFRRGDPADDDPTAEFEAQIRHDRIEVLDGLIEIDGEGVLVGGERVRFLTRPRRQAATALAADQTYRVYAIEIAGTRLLLSLDEG